MLNKNKECHMPKRCELEKVTEIERQNSLDNNLSCYLPFAGKGSAGFGNPAGVGEGFFNRVGSNPG
jgi:hypothetical protein